MTNKPKRLLSLDLLRIVSMCMIITLHFISYSNISDDVFSFSKIGLLNTILHSICNVAVNCYILISGYFCIKNKFKITKIYKLVIEVFVYSMIIYIIMILTNRINFRVKEFFFNFFPVLTRQYWFITSYLGVYIVSPFLRMFVNRINRFEHLSVIITGFLLFVLYYNLFFFCDNLNFGGATGIVWFIYLYLCAMYIFKYYEGKGWKREVKNYIIIVVLALLSRFPFYILYLITNKNIFLQGASIFDSVYNSIFPFVASISLFKVFLNISIEEKSTKIFNILSVSSWYIYILHENKYIREILWGKIDYKNFVNNSVIRYAICWIGIIISIYILGLCISFVINKILLNTLLKKKTLDKIEKFQNSIYCCFEKTVERRIINENK